MRQVPRILCSLSPGSDRCVVQSVSFLLNLQGIVSHPVACIPGTSRHRASSSIDSNRWRCPVKLFLIFFSYLLFLSEDLFFFDSAYFARFLEGKTLSEPFLFFFFHPLTPPRPFLFNDFYPVQVYMHTVLTDSTSHPSLFARVELYLLCLCVWRCLMLFRGAKHRTSLHLPSNTHTHTYIRIVAICSSSTLTSAR